MIYYDVHDVAKTMGVDAEKAREIMTQEDFPLEKGTDMQLVSAEKFDEWLRCFSDSVHRYEIELVTAQDVADFVNAVDGADGDVRIKGQDEHGNDWEVSAKSMLLTLCAASRSQLAQARRAEGKDSAYNVDWNTLRCESSEDIYSRISRFVKGSTLE